MGIYESGTVITIKDVIRKSDLLQCLKHLKLILVNLFGFLFMKTGKVELLTQYFTITACPPRFSVGVGHRLEW